MNMTDQATPLTRALPAGKTVGVAQNKKYEILNLSSAKQHSDTRNHMNPIRPVTPHQGSP